MSIQYFLYIASGNNDRNLEWTDRWNNRPLDMRVPYQFSSGDIVDFYEAHSNYREEREALVRHYGTTKLRILTREFMFQNNISGDESGGCFTLWVEPYLDSL